MPHLTALRRYTVGLNSRGGGNAVCSAVVGVEVPLQPIGVEYYDVLWGGRT
jgi:hypothetical protein